MAELRDYDAWHSHYDDPGSGLPALGVVRYAGPPVDLMPGQPLFTFLR